LNPGATGRPVRDPDHRIQSALSTLRQALAGQEVQAICGAYHALRNFTDPAGRQKLPEWIEQALGLEAMHAIVSAYSHLHCFMCSGGLVPCESCEGAGHDDGDPCPYCRGLGIAPCTFCRGTGWADRNLLPEELRQAVLQRQLLGVRGYATQLAGLFARVNPEAVKTMSPPRRRQLAAELIHLRARLTDMAENAASNTEANVGLAKAARKVENVLRSLGRRG
jgi:hypothetical protein